MKGWKVRSFAEKRFHHYRTLGTAEKGALGALYDYGKRAYSLGSSPIWHVVRCLYRMKSQPYVLRLSTEERYAPAATISRRSSTTSSRRSARTTIAVPRRSRRAR